jgi:hypothetical protein
MVLYAMRLTSAECVVSVSYSMGFSRPMLKPTQMRNHSCATFAIKVLHNRMIILLLMLVFTVKVNLTGVMNVERVSAKLIIL